MRIASVVCVCVALSAGGCFKSMQPRLSSLGDKAAALEKRLLPASPVTQQMIAVAANVVASKIPMVAQAQQVAQAAQGAPADTDDAAPADPAPVDAQVAVAQRAQPAIAMPVVMSRAAAPRTVFVLHTATDRCEVHASLQECNATCGRMARAGTSCNCVEQTGGC